MGNEDLGCLHIKAKDLQVLARHLQEQADLLEAEVRIRLTAALEERDLLSWRVDPFSSDANSLADLDF